MNTLFLEQIESLPPPPPFSVKVPLYSIEPMCQNIKFSLDLHVHRVESLRHCMNVRRT